MAFTGIEFFSAVLVVSRDAERLHRFYKDVLGFPLETEKHGGTAPHYGCELGDLHFAIHPLENFPGTEAGVGSVKLAFEVFDIEGFVARLRSHGVEPLYAPKPFGIGQITAVKDPDGNLLEFTQLSERWYSHLEKRRGQGHDLIGRWKQQRPSLQ